MTKPARNRQFSPAFPPSEARRFSDGAKAERWFGRNCKDVLKRLSVSELNERQSALSQHLGLLCEANVRDHARIARRPLFAPQGVAIQIINLLHRTFCAR
jgi:hypothetical protein